MVNLEGIAAGKRGEMEAPASKPGVGWLVVSRPREWIFMFFPYRIFVDGGLRTLLPRGEEATIPVSVGFHQVVGKIDWWRTNPVDVCVETGQTCRLKIGCTITPLWLPLFPFFLIVSAFQPARYLFLRREESE
jgi:hypothetical protein